MPADEIALLRRYAEESYNTYVSKRSAADSAVSAAEAFKLRLTMSGNGSKSKWQDSLDARMDASAAALEMRTKASLWAEAAKAKALCIPAGEDTDAERERCALEAANAAAVFAQRLDEEAKEREGELRLLKRISADVARERAVKKDAALDAYATEIRGLLVAKMTEMENLREVMAKVNGKGGNAAAQKREKLVKNGKTRCFCVK